jgi:hypothetical protein
MNRNTNQVMNCVAGDAPATPEIPAEIGKLSSAVDRLYARLDVLSARLGSALVQRPEMTAGEDKVELYPCTDIARAVRGERDRIEGMAARVNDLLDRLGL